MNPVVLEKMEVRTQQARLEALIARFERRFGAEWAQQLERLRTGLPLAVLIRHLDTTDVEAIEADVDRLLQGALDQTFAVSTAAFLAGGQERIAQLNQALKLQLAFDLVAEQTVQVLRSRQLQFVREVGEETRLALRQSLERSLREGIHPTEAARRFRASIGLTRRQEQAVHTFRRGLETLDRTVLERQLRDRRFDRTIRQALRSQVPLKPEQIDRMVDRYRARFLKHRAETIARTETLGAIHGASHQAFVQVAGQLEPGQQLRRFWVYTHDNRTRDAHVRIPGLNPQGVEPEGRYRTPLGPLRYPHDPAGTPANIINCRCTEVFRTVEDEE